MTVDGRRLRVTRPMPWHVFPITALAMRRVTRCWSRSKQRLAAERAITVPTIVLHGDADGVSLAEQSPPIAGIRMIAESFP